jgi:hypothetical protein
VLTRQKKTIDAFRAVMERWGNHLIYAALCDVISVVTEFMVRMADGLYILRKPLIYSAVVYLQCCVACLFLCPSMNFVTPAAGVACLFDAALNHQFFPIVPSPPSLPSLQVWLTCLVVLHHACVAFFVPSWPLVLGYDPLREDSFGWFAIVFLPINQSYFMALFFFISGYFTPTSLDRKGPAEFMADKLKRLGIVIDFDQMFYSLEDAVAVHAFAP